MLKKVFGTLTTKILAAFLSLCIVTLTTHFLGASGRGEISLITADITIVLLFSQIVGGPSIVYLFSRMNPFQLLLSACIWAMLVPLILLPLLSLVGLIEHNFLFHLIIICVLYGIASACQILFIGAKKIEWYNYLNALQVLFLFLGLILFFIFLKEKKVINYIYSLYIAYITSFCITLILILKVINNYSFNGFWSTVKESFVRGFIVQLGNLIQFLNYRLSFFFLQDQLAALGVFSIALVLAEAVWLIGNSLSLVQYSEISNEREKEKSIHSSFLYAKISFWATGLCVLILTFLPRIFFEWIFGPEFGDAKVATLALCPGIFAIGFGMSLSHYFAGIGKFRINNIASLIGLLVKIPACFILIPNLNETGAALACSLSYIASFIYYYIRFKKETAFSFSNLYISTEEVGLLKKLLCKTISYIKS